MFALGLTFEPMDRFQSVLYENCQECLTAPGHPIKIKILFCPRFEPGTLMFALSLTFEPMDRFQSVLHLNCLEFSVQSNGAMSNSSRSPY